MFIPVHAGEVEQLLVVTGGGDAGVVLRVQTVLRCHTPTLALHRAYICSVYSVDILYSVDIVYSVDSDV